MAYLLLRIVKKVQHTKKQYNIFYQSIEMIKHYQCQEFSQKASRYILAMKETPFARLMELIPILYLLPSKKDVLLDLFAGTGFVSQFLASQFSKIIQIDEVESLLNSYSYPSISIKGDALDPDVLSVVHDKINMAICFAGFHHIFKKKNGELDEQITERLRISALAEWREMLDKDGCLLVVDVPAPGNMVRAETTLPVHSAFPTDIPGDYVSPANQIFRAIGGRNPFDGPDDSHDLKSYLDKLMSDLSGFSWRKPEPAEFFESFVSANSTVGHQACFQSVENLLQCFKNAGFSKVDSFIAPTPWFFEKRSQALWFINELFAISEIPYATPDELSEEDSIILSEAVDRYLGFTDLPGGACLIWWKLMYVWGTR